MFVKFGKMFEKIEEKKFFMLVQDEKLMKENKQVLFYYK